MNNNNNNSHEINRALRPNDEDLNPNNADYNKYINNTVSNSIAQEKFMELPPDVDDDRYDLMQMEDYDIFGNKHIYYVYEDPETHLLKLSIGNEEFFDKHPDDSETVKTIKQFFINLKETLEIRNELQKRTQGLPLEDSVSEFTDDENSNGNNELTTTQKSNLFKKITENFKKKISNRKKLNNRLELYRLINSLNDNFVLLQDVCKNEDIMMSLRKLKVLSDSLSNDDLAEQEAEKNRLLQILEAKQSRRNQHIAAAKEANRTAAAAAMRSIFSGRDTVLRSRRRNHLSAAANGEQPPNAKRARNQNVWGHPAYRTGFVPASSLPRNYRPQAGPVAPPLTPPPRDFVPVPETPRRDFEPVSQTPPRDFVPVPETPRVNSENPEAFAGGSRRIKSIRKNKKTLKSSNKLKKTNKKTKKIKPCK